MIDGITSPAIRYTGSKWRIAPWIIQYIPKHVCYMEPFCGGANVLLRKKPSDVEVINDINGDVVNFFQVLRSSADELVRQITLTPFSRQELSIAYEPCEDSMERARRLYVRSRQSYTAGEAPISRGWRFEINQTRALGEWNTTNHLYAIAHRLKNVMIECKPAIQAILLYDDPKTLFYCDPPYTSETRSGNREYKNEMTDADHIALSEVLRSIKGMALISGYDSPLYQELYADWHMTSIESRTVNNVKRRECLWISPNAEKNTAQRRLF
jgi:DNA adenine methylase